MAKNYVQDGCVLELTAPYAVSAGAGAQVGSVFGVALNDVANAAVGEFATEGVWDLTALSTATGAQGAKAYWDNSNKRVDTDSTIGILIGALATAKTNGQTTARVKLNEGVADELRGTLAAIPSLTDSTGAGANDSILAAGVTASAPAAITSAVLTGALTGAVDTVLENVAAAAGACAGGATPTATNVDTAIATAVAPLVTGINLQNVDMQAQINALHADVVALRTPVAALVTDDSVHNQNISDIAAKLNALLAELRTAGIIAP